LVEGANIYLKGKINLTDGSGFFGLFVGKDANGNKGNIIIDPSVGGMADGVPEIQGLYLADGTFSTGVADTQLHIKGAVAGLNGVNLQRDLVDDSVTPAEYFEYAPDQVMFLINKNLGVRKLNWKEVAP
jgi:hypothetical protein